MEKAIIQAKEGSCSGFCRLAEEKAVLLGIDNVTRVLFMQAIPRLSIREAKIKGNTAYSGKVSYAFFPWQKRRYATSKVWLSRARP